MLRRLPPPSARVRPWTVCSSKVGVDGEGSPAGCTAEQLPRSVPPAGCPQLAAPRFQQASAGPSSSSSSPLGFAARSISTSRAAWADVTVEVPSMGESITEGAVAAILKQPGDVVVEDDVIAQLETDKVTMDIKWQHKMPGVVREILVSEGDNVTVGQAFAKVEERPDAAPAAAKPEAAAAAEAPPPPPPKPPKPAAEAAPAAVPAGLAQRPERRVKMTRLRTRVAERLKNAQNTYAMLSTFNEVDMTALMEMRSHFKAVPAVNGVIDGDEIIYRDYCDISVAVATPKGLVVPVLRNADAMSFADVEKTINMLGKKARDGTLSIDEMAGGTFTISNGGVFGSMLSTPIINPPQSAILGMHATNMKPAVVNGQIVPRPIMNLALTYDHRLIDGREAVTFLKRIKEIIEDPRRLLLDI
eukprot:scaffold6.g2764.t1